MSDHSEPALVPDAERDSLRLQILATEHWSLLATRSMLWSESFNRTGMFLTVVSASVVGLAFVGQAADFGRDRLPRRCSAPAGASGVLSGAAAPRPLGQPSLRIHGCVAS